MNFEKEFKIIELGIKNKTDHWNNSNKKCKNEKLAACVEHLARLDEAKEYYKNGKDDMAKGKIVHLTDILKPFWPKPGRLIIYKRNFLLLIL
jgi:hypothetical protein